MTLLRGKVPISVARCALRRYLLPRLGRPLWLSSELLVLGLIKVIIARRFAGGTLSQHMSPCAKSLSHGSGQLRRPARQSNSAIRWVMGRLEFLIYREPVQYSGYA